MDQLVLLHVAGCLSASVVIGLYRYFWEKLHPVWIIVAIVFTFAALTPQTVVDCLLVYRAIEKNPWISLELPFAVLLWEVVFFFLSTFVIRQLQVFLLPVYALTVTGGSVAFIAIPMALYIVFSVSGGYLVVWSATAIIMMVAHALMMIISMLGENRRIAAY